MTNYRFIKLDVYTLNVITYICFMKVKSIEEEIQQTSFKSAAHRVAVNLIYTAKEMENEMALFLKDFDLTSEQFNVLRILRGQDGKPTSVKLIVERMLDKSSNVSRLLDKLVKKAWVERKECANDRRQVDVTITESGLQLLTAVDQQMNSFKKKNLEMSEEDLNTLSQLLDRWRSIK